MLHLYVLTFKYCVEQDGEDWSEIVEIVLVYLFRYYFQNSWI